MSAAVWGAVDPWMGCLLEGAAQVAGEPVVAITLDYGDLDGIYLTVETTARRGGHSVNLEELRGLDRDPMRLGRHIAHCALTAAEKP